jgi:hypothetical protein
MHDLRSAFDLRPYTLGAGQMHKLKNNTYILFTKYNSKKMCLGNSLPPNNFYVSPSVLKTLGPETTLGNHNWRYGITCK